MNRRKYVTALRRGNRASSIGQLYSKRAHRGSIHELGSGVLSPVSWQHDGRTPDSCRALRRTSGQPWANSEHLAAPWPAPILNRLAEGIVSAMN